MRRVDELLSKSLNLVSQKNQSEQKNYQTRFQGMRITHIDHFNISLKHAALETIRDFYVNVIGLTEGARPNFNFPGY